MEECVHLIVRPEEMVRFSLDEGTGGSKRKKRSTEGEGDLVKRRSKLGFRKPYTSEDDESEKERDEIEDNGETEDAADSSMCGGSNANGEMAFRIESEALECSICLEPLRPPIFQGSRTRRLERELSPNVQGSDSPPIPMQRTSSSSHHERGQEERFVLDKLVDQFHRMHPPHFDGRTDPLVAERWTNQMNRIFDAMNCPDHRRVSLAILMLEDDAIDWWESRHRIRFLRRPVREISWQDFIEDFENNYIPISARESMRMELSELVQNGMTISEWLMRCVSTSVDIRLCYHVFSKQCENGHIACSSCCPKLFNKCHVCSSFIGRQRCLALEKVIESIKSQCQYANYGCRATLSFLEKASHEETCCHAALFCPINNCTFSGTKQLLAIHVKTKHCCIVKNFNYDQPFMLTMEKLEPFLLLLGDDDHLFLLNSHETCSMTALSVICISSNTPKCQFSYELRLHSRGSSLQLRTSAEKVRRWSGVHPSKVFLVIPDYFCSNVGICVDVCIQKSFVFGLYGKENVF